MADEAVGEEIQVLESIYPAELTIVSQRKIHVEVEPDDVVEGGEPIKVLLQVTFPETYPDVVPEVSIEPVIGELGLDELEELMKQLKAMGEENIGMAMTFTLVTHLKEVLSELAKVRLNRKQEEARRRELHMLEEEEKRYKGTSVTLESFKRWKTRFDEEMAKNKTREEEERLRALTPKEREEYKKMHNRITGRQLFERHRILEDTSLFEDGTVSVDASQYERNHEREEQREENSMLSDNE